MSAAAPTPRKARTRRLSCPGCGGSIEVRANGISISAICPSCGRTVDLASDELHVIAEAQAATRTLTIPIGTRGALAGSEWEVVGYQARSNPAEGSTWDEYLLFNPYRGFRFLAHDDEGWTLFCMLRQDIADLSHVEGDPHRYRGPDTGQARTDYVLGEFYWRVRVGDTADTEQYESGPSLLVKEVTGDEIVWSRGFKVPTDQVRSAFKLTPDPQPEVSPRQQTMAVLWIGIAACVLLTLLYAIRLSSSESREVFHNDYRVTASDKGRTIASAPFAVPNRGGNLRFDLYAPVQNDWLALNLSLVGEGGTPVLDATSTIEYYSGYDDDGSWDEGSQRARVLFRSVPGGNYRLLVDVDAGALDKPPPKPSTGVVFDFNKLTVTPAPAPPPPPEPAVSFTIDAYRHAPAPEWYWFGLLLIVPYPAYRLLFKRGTT